MKLFKKLQVWRDPLPRSGPESMAIDQWLLESLGDVPFLRIYDWEGDWVSLGYFQSLSEAQRIFGDVPSYVRRWTGGGIVDHRCDQTYTLAIPRSEKLASARGAEVYAEIHRELGACLRAGGIPCELTPCNSGSGSAACFENPVAWDLLGSDGVKLAGAGQRRARQGILHQGSVSVSEGALEDLGSFMSEQCDDFLPEELSGWEEMVAKFRSPDWLQRVR